MPAKIFTSTIRTLGPRADRFKYPHQALRVAAKLTRPDVAEIHRPAAAGDQLIDQHHREACAGRDQADLSFRIDLDVVESVAELMVGVRIRRKH